MTTSTLEQPGAVLPLPGTPSHDGRVIASAHPTTGTTADRDIVLLVRGEYPYGGQYAVIRTSPNGDEHRALYTRRTPADKHFQRTLKQDSLG